MTATARRSAAQLLFVAASGGYGATLAAPAPAAKTIVNGVIWHCDGTTCSAPLDGARPAIACGKMVRALGPVTRFVSPKGELSAEDLTRCNAAAS